MWSSAERFRIRTVAGLTGVLGVAWLYTFALTDYRPHLSPIMLPLGLMTVGLAIWMAALKIWAISIMAALAILVAIGSILIQIVAGEIHGFLLAILVLALLFLALILPGLRRHFFKWSRSS